MKRQRSSHAVAQQVDTGDLAESKGIALDRWQRRPWVGPLKEWTARIGAYGS